MNRKTQFSRTRGFTLVEIMIVVVIIGILATMAIPAINRVKYASQNSRIMNDFRIFAAAFINYNMENGAYPPDGAFDFPTGMDDYLPTASWNSPPLGGQWIWDQNDWNVTAAVSYRNSRMSVPQMTRLDERYDDGDLTSGKFQRISSDRYSYIIEP